VPSDREEFPFQSITVACRLCLALARLNKPHRLLLELKRITSPRCLRHLRYPFALEQLAKGYFLREQGQNEPVQWAIYFEEKPLGSRGFAVQQPEEPL
jgi:hypothetical protein